MNLYFQFLTQNQTADAVEILRFIPALIDGQGISGRVKITAHTLLSSSARYKYLGCDALIAKLAKRRFNLVEVKLEGAELRLAGTFKVVKAVKGIFSPSATSELWLPTREWRTDATRDADNRYMNARNREDVFKFLHISRVPSVLELLLEIDDKASLDDALDRCAEWITGTAPMGNSELKPFGCCDVVEPVFIPQLNRSILVPERFQIIPENVKPEGYSQLGDRFDALHPLMFGSKRLCKGISDALGREARLIVAGHAKDFAAIRLVLTDERESLKRRAASWLIDDFFHCGQ